MAGQFEIQGLDESMTFSVLVAKESFRASLERIDPVKDELDVKLKPWKTDIPENQKMLGTISDADGNPIAGAVVWASGVMQNGRKMWGQFPGIDRVSVTGKDGKFLLTSETPFEQWELTVRANGFCQHKTEHQPLGSKPYEIELRRGANVSGRVVDKEGKALSGHVVGILQRNRMALGNWVGERTIATDDKGNFNFTAVLPETEWAIYSAVEGRDDVEFFQSELFDSGRNGAEQGLGEFKVKGHSKLTGRLILPEGVALPDEARVTISRKFAWMPQNADVAADGSFVCPNLPMGEPLVITVVAKGLLLDPERQSIQRNRRDGELGIFLDKVKEEIRIPLMKAPPVRSNKG